MKIETFAGYNIFFTNIIDEHIDIDQILQEFHQHTDNYQYTHYINNRWENIYLSPQDVPSVLPLLSFALSNSLELYRDILKPHQTLIIPHELLGYEKNEFWFNTASKGQSTRMHNHNEKAFISGVFYLQVPEGSANLFFKSGKHNELEVESKSGKIVFFPAALDHYVPENRSCKVRISLAFNCYIFPLSASITHGLSL